MLRALVGEFLRCGYEATLPKKLSFVVSVSLLALPLGSLFFEKYGSLEFFLFLPFFYFFHFEGEIFFEIVGRSEVAFGSFEVNGRGERADAGLFLDEETVVVFGDGCGELIGDAGLEGLAHDNVDLVAEDGFVECGVILGADAAGFDAALVDIG